MTRKPPPPSTPPTKAHVVRCPGCGGPSRYAPDNPFRPFCSERCKLADLGAWANEEFRVGAVEDADGPLDDAPESGSARPPRH
ncbi:DNA gyrase inhibitor YacG [Ottowia sp.]|uniref:DNA gyrase inhibitor YacG n=1 Tax=Ottowia sp. TaxID=1898956 RepID=UPI00345E890E